MAALTLLAVAAVTAFSAFGLPGGLKFYVVQSGSMEPTIKTGSLIVGQASQNYQQDDVVTFIRDAQSDPKNPRSLVTHRIVEATVSASGETFYTTRGDANNANDLRRISKNLVLGKVVLTLPFLGYPVAFAKTQNGFILLIVIPATIIVYSELMNIKKEALRLIAERKKRKLSVREKIEEKIGEGIIEIEKDAAVLRSKKR